jgi:hypothetical protein
MSDPTADEWVDPVVEADKVDVNRTLLSENLSSRRRIGFWWYSGRGSSSRNCGAE